VTGLGRRRPLILGTLLLFDAKQQRALTSTRALFMVVTVAAVIVATDGRRGGPTTRCSPSGVATKSPSVLIAARLVLIHAGRLDIFVQREIIRHGAINVSGRVRLATGLAGILEGL
jgi:hypothetical protein